MTPKEKAEEIIDKFYQATPESIGTGKDFDAGCKMALLAVNEILNIYSLSNGWAKGIDLPLRSDMKPYWIEVKKHIEAYDSSI